MVSEIRIQRHLLSSRVAREVGWGNYSPWLAALCPLARAWTEQRIADEQRFFAAGPPVPQGTYTRLQKKVADLQPNQMVLQIGARTGWQAKTLGSVLQADSGRFEVLLAEHNMIGGDEGRFPGDPWPSTRTLTYRDDQWKEPLGWICLTIDGWRTTDLPTKFSPPRRPEE